MQSGFAAVRKAPLGGARASPYSNMVPPSGLILPPGAAGQQQQGTVAGCQEVCQFFSKSGWCKYGDACRFVHEGGSQAGSQMGKGGSQSAEGGQAGSSQVELCQFFAKSGWCKYGDQCRFIHAVHTRGMGQAGAAPASQSAGMMGKGAMIPPASAAGGNPDEPEVCRFFQKAGWCKLGEHCRFVHERSDVGGAPLPGGGPIDEACQFYQKAGWCKYGEACRFMHALGPSGMPGAGHGPPPTGAGAMSNMPMTDSLSGADGEACQFFAKAGWCKFGDSCKFAHVAGQGGVTSAETMGGSRPVEVCLFFARAGWCKYGDQCRHSHTPGAEEAGEAEGEVGFTS